MPHAHARGPANPFCSVFLLTCIVLVSSGRRLTSNCLALLADAGHMATDAWGSAWPWSRSGSPAGHPTAPGRIFGYLRLEIFAAVVNAVLLFGVAGFVLFEASRRLQSRPESRSG